MRWHRKSRGQTPFKFGSKELTVQPVCRYVAAAPENFRVQTDVAGFTESLVLRVYTVPYCDCAAAVPEDIHEALAALLCAPSAHDVRQALAPVRIWLQPENTLPHGRISVGALREMLMPWCLLTVVT